MIGLLFAILFLLPLNGWANTYNRCTDFHVGSTLDDVVLDCELDIIKNTLTTLDNNNANTSGGYRFIEIVNSLPANGNQGRIVFLTADNTLYYDNGTSWIKTATYSGTAAQGDILYFNGTLFALLNKNTTATRYLSNTGTSNNPEWNQVDLVNGSKWTGQNGGDLIFASSSTVVSRLPAGLNGQVLKLASGLPAWSTASNIQIYTSSDTFTAPANVTKVYLTIIAGGGGGRTSPGGGNGGGGGGAGAYILNYPFTVTPGNGYTVTIGAGGTGGNSGGTTSFDSVSVSGGGSGTASATAATSSGGMDASGGTGGGQTLKAGNGANGDASFSGGGAGTPFGTGGAGVAVGACSNGAGGSASANTGAGGGGGQCNGGTGGSGGSGLIIVMW